MKIKFFHFLAPVDNMSWGQDGMTCGHDARDEEMRRWGDEEVRRCAAGQGRWVMTKRGECYDIGETQTPVQCRPRRQDSVLVLTLPLYIKCVLLHAKLAARPILYGQFIFLTSSHVWQSKDVGDPMWSPESGHAHHVYCQMSPQHLACLLIAQNCLSCNSCQYCVK